MLLIGSQNFPGCWLERQLLCWFYHAENTSVYLPSLNKSDECLSNRDLGSRITNTDRWACDVVTVTGHRWMEAHPPISPVRIGILWVGVCPAVYKRSQGQDRFTGAIWILLSIFDTFRHTSTVFPSTLSPAWLL